MELCVLYIHTPVAGFHVTMTTGKQCLLDTAGQLPIETHSSYDSMHKTCDTEARPNLSMKKRDGHEVLPLV